MLKVGLVAGTDFLIGDASQWRGTRLCGPLLERVTNQVLNVHGVRDALLARNIGETLVAVPLSTAVQHLCDKMLTDSDG
jgi:hypothetical protein